MNDRRQVTAQEEQMSHLGGWESPTTYIIGVDTGGTFTDLVAVDGEGRLVFDKAFSTPDDPERGVMAALDTVTAALHREPEQVAGATTRLAHGTTVATNALIQSHGARVGLVLTLGFEDTPVIARGPMSRNLGVPVHQAMDFIHNERPAPLVPKTLIRGVPERVAIDGAVIAPLAEDTAARAIEDLVGDGVESLAVCLLSSFRNPTHEQCLRELASAAAPSLPVSLSSEVSPVIGEFERVMTTIVNAYVGPVIVRYVNRLQEHLAERGFRHPVQLMMSSGGVTLPQTVDRKAVALVNSGPVGGLVAAKHLGELLGHTSIITTDMGGTSFDVGVIHRGEYELDTMPFVAQGIPVQLPAARVVTLGAGGGSIAWTDGRRLQVGPRSAGAEPGPACYGWGGEDPTVTDALVVAGILDPDRFFGGRRRLCPDRAVDAIEQRIAKPLGLDVQEAAAGIYEIVTAKMADLIRKVTVESGYDPREFVVFAYGGAAPAHAALYTWPLGVRATIVPHVSSTFSALGCALTDVRYTYARSQPTPLDASPKTSATIAQVFADLDARALHDMSVSGYEEADVTLLRRMDLRYEGQMHEIPIPLAEGMFDPGVVGRLREAFTAQYETRFGPGTSRPESPVEAITFRVEALKQMPKPTWPREPEGGPDPTLARCGSRQVYLRQTGAIEAAVYTGEDLRPGNVVRGPAIVERRDTTVLVPPDHDARMDGYRNLTISETR